MSAQYLPSNHPDQRQTAGRRENVIAAAPATDRFSVRSVCDRLQCPFVSLRHCPQTPPPPPVVTSAGWTHAARRTVPCSPGRSGRCPRDTGRDRCSLAPRTGRGAASTRGPSTRACSGTGRRGTRRFRSRAADTPLEAHSAPGWLAVTGRAAARGSYGTAVTGSTGKRNVCGKCQALREADTEAGSRLTANAAC